MIDLLQKTLLAGIGALALSQKKAEELISELQKQFNLGDEKAREMLASLRETVRHNQQQLEELARDEVRKACSECGLVTQEAFEKLEQRVLALEKQLETDQP
jgi:Uncharacterized conserved protein